VWYVKKFGILSREKYKTCISHTYLPLTVAKLSTLKNSPPCIIYWQSANAEVETNICQTDLQVHRAQNEAQFLLGVKERLAHLEVVSVVQWNLVVTFVFTLSNAAVNCSRWAGSSSVGRLVTYRLAILGKYVVRCDLMAHTIHTSSITSVNEQNTHDSFILLLSKGITELVSESILLNHSSMAIEKARMM